MRHPHWSTDHRDALLTRVSAITVGVAAASAVGAVALGAGMQAGTRHASAQTTTPADQERSQAPAGGDENSNPSVAADTAPAPSTAAVEKLNPEQIHLVVYNATSTKGVAHAAADILRKEGFQVDTIATNPGGALRSSAILFSTTSAGGVHAVSQATGIRRTATADTGATVILVLGRDWLTATAGTPWAPPQAAPQYTGGSTSGGGSRSGGGPVTSSGGS